MLGFIDGYDFGEMPVRIPRLANFGIFEAKKLY